jgi:glycerol-3-phosphate acyltransferase PlsY
MVLLTNIKCVGLALLAFLLGSIPWGLILTRRFCSVDIRQAGSGNIGATNVMRTSGITLGALTLMGDVFKGALPVWFAVKIIGYPDLWQEACVSLVALCAFLGHLYPIFLKFKTGGKGVATAAGCFLIISPSSCVIIFIIFVIIAAASNRVSAGSLAAATALPFIVWSITQANIITAGAVIIAILICLRHKDNIKRLVSGTEPTIWRRKNK